MTQSTLIVARLVPGGAAHVARLFAESDATDLPVALGVRRRELFSYRDLYFHHVEFAGDRSEALRRAAQRPDFRELSAQLASYVTPYDPDTWRSPADAMAGEFYSWSPAPGSSPR